MFIEAFDDFSVVNVSVTIGSIVEESVEKEARVLVLWKFNVVKVSTLLQGKRTKRIAFSFFVLNSYVLSSFFLNSKLRFFLSSTNWTQSEEKQEALFCVKKFWLLVCVFLFHNSSSPLSFEFNIMNSNKKPAFVITECTPFSSVKGTQNKLIFLFFPNTKTYEFSTKKLRILLKITATQMFEFSKKNSFSNPQPVLNSATFSIHKNNLLEQPLSFGWTKSLLGDASNK